jgi:hypothetical protein
MKSVCGSRTMEGMCQKYVQSFLPPEKCWKNVRPLHRNYTNCTVMTNDTRGHLNPTVSYRPNSYSDPALVLTRAVTRQEIPSTSSKETLLLSKDGSSAHQVPQQVSQIQNGMHLLREKQSILTQSSLFSTTSTALTKASGVLDLLKSSLEGRSPRQRLKRAASRPQRSTSSSKLRRSFSPIATTSLDNMKITSKSFSQRNQPQSILNCSNTTKQLDTKSDRDRTSYLLTEDSLPATTKPLSRQTVSELREQLEEIREFQEKLESLKKNWISAIGSMEQTDVPQPLKSADINTSVKSAKNVDIEKWTAKLRECEQLGKRPHYLRHNVYRDDEMVSHSSAEWTEKAKPLASVPVGEFSNTFAFRTIDKHPGLFTVDMPINIDEFEGLLTNHPNPLFVQSVVRGFRNGFWPWADTQVGEYPDLWDKSLGDSRD